MITSPLQANDEMFDIVKNAATNVAAFLLYSDIDIRWQGKELSTIPNSNQIWLRVLKKELTEEKLHIGYLNAKALYTHTGILSVELFGSTSIDNVWELLRSSAVLIRNSFRKPSLNNIRFTPKIVELNPENDYYKINVVINYEYDEGIA